MATANNPDIEELKNKFLGGKNIKKVKLFWF
jgi:hypothetical protein